MFTRLILVLLLLSPSVAWAQDPTSTSASQMLLTTSPVFLARLQYFLVQRAGVVMAEAHNTACHAARIAYANAIVSSPAQAAANAAALIASSNVGGAVIVGTVVQWATGPYAGQYDSNAGDTALNQAVTNAYNTLARCDSGS